MSFRLGVIGSPISHSLSPQLHEAGLRAVGLEGGSTRHEVDQDSFTAFMATASESFDALSVTAPLKTLAYERAGELTDAARAVEAVNSLLFRDGKIYGHNTDGEGFVSALRARFQTDFADCHVVVLGAGGAARSIIRSLVQDGVSSIAVHGRSEENVNRACAPYSNVFGFSLVYRPVDLVINTIPSSSRHVEKAVLQGISPDSAAVDITYEPRQSQWRGLYENLGCQTDNGLRMLAHQAAAQLTWWLERDFDGEALLELIA